MGKISSIAIVIEIFVEQINLLSCSRQSTTHTHSKNAFVSTRNSVKKHLKWHFVSKVLQFGFFDDGIGSEKLLISKNSPIRRFWVRKEATKFLNTYSLKFIKSTYLSIVPNKDVAFQ